MGVRFLQDNQGFITGDKLLRYSISDWSQLSRCLSNHDKRLHIAVTNFLPDNRVTNGSTPIRGRRIEVVHPDYGTLFAYTMNAEGTFVVSNNDGSIIPELTVGQILAELQRFGFFISYDPINSMSGPMIDFLMTIRDLHFDKLRILPVKFVDTLVDPYIKVKPYIVAFQVQYLPRWLEATYVASEAEFLKAAANGYMFNVTSVTQHRDFDWSWLDGWVGDINDIIRDTSFIRP